MSFLFSRCPWMKSAGLGLNGSRPAQPLRSRAGSKSLDPVFLAEADLTRYFLRSRSPGLDRGLGWVVVTRVGTGRGSVMNVIESEFNVKSIISKVQISNLKLKI